MVPDTVDVIGPPAASPHRTAHRASYILERGRWKATCRDCGWQTSNPKRQVTASLFRIHIQAERRTGPAEDGAGAPPAGVRDGAGAPPAGVKDGGAGRIGSLPRS